MIEDEYTILIHKSLTGQITAAENAELHEWLALNTQHAREYNELKKIWDLPVEDDPIDPRPMASSRDHLQDDLTVLIAKERHVQRFKRLAIYACAACGLALMSCAYLYFYLSQNREASYTISSGNPSTIWLSDSSRVTLDNSSSLTSRFTHAERIVDLTGEAFFSIAKDNRPFIVHSSGGDIRVKSTSFHVRAFYNQHLEVVVVSGVVDVYLQERTWRLRQGEYLSLKDGVNSKIASANEYHLRLGARGKLEFKMTPLPEVIQRVEEIYSIRCSLPESLEACRFTGSFDGIPLTDVIKILSYSMNMQFEKTGEDAYRIVGTGCTK